MAVIEQEPLNLMPSGNPIVFAFSQQYSALTTEIYFEVKVYIEGTLQGTYQVIPESVWNDGVNDQWYSKFDTSQILEDYITENRRHDSDIVTGSHIQYYIEVTDYKDGSSGTLDTSNTLNAFKGSLTNEDWIDWNAGTIFPLTTAGSVYASGTEDIEFLTQYPTTENYYVATDEQVFLFYIGKTRTLGDYRGVSRAQIELFTSAGASITTGTWDFGATYEINTPDRASINIDASPQAIADNTTIVIGDFSTCAYYTIQFEVDSQLSPGTYITCSEVYTFHIDLECSMYDNKRIYFLSRVGSIEAMTFRLVDRERRNITQHTVSKRWGEFVPDGTTSNDYTFSLEQGGVQTYKTETTRRLIIETDFMSEDLQNWLVKNLYESPYVVVNYNGKLQRCKILNTQSEVKKRVNDALIRETIQLEVSLGDNGIRL